jgi:Electron transfer flavoprotein, alpha subunit
MSQLKDVWIFAENLGTLAELCTCGWKLGQSVSALVIGSSGDAENALTIGVDRVFWLEKSESVMLEDYTLSIYNHLLEKQPQMLLLGASTRARLIAGRLAAKLETSVLTDVMDCLIEESNILANRMVYGGTAIQTEQSDSKIVIATVGSGVFKPVLQGEIHGSIETIPFAEPQRRIRCLERRAKDTVAVNLHAAKRIIAVGRGIANKDDLKMVEEFAGLVNAEIGCTRPISEGEGWLPRERYIGVSGVMQLKPDIYFAVGVSGQIQHMVGCNQARIMVAINQDKNAPIFKQTDYGIVGDLYKVIPALISKFQATN